MKRLLAISAFMVCQMWAVISCEADDAPRGPLAAIAESTLAYGLECTEEEHWPLLPYLPPFQDCRGTVADTLMIVVTNALNTAGFVGRSWSLGPMAIQTYRDQLERLRRQYGDGITVPPPIEDHHERLLTMWDFGTHHLVLRANPSDDIIHLQWWLERPEY